MIFIHESYLSSSHQNDIGLLRLPTNVEYKSYIKPICIVVNPQEIWSKSHINSFLFGQSFKQKSYKFQCSGVPCKSVGNPLTIMSETKNVIQHGILSYRNATTCGLVYTNVMAHVEWITSRALDADINY
ncbi:uncharacterized protein LOC108115939 [Drosophila eugracilis]|uniref:uncharacterized protein LOC108115939 n=1 Tax=Drosophila eugracilis TaxID=29029 RepID=UPI0007E6AE11|nr:uncharacterized protein LOC108115939 [Drosophila eugracilis]